MSLARFFRNKKMLNRKALLGYSVILCAAAALFFHSRPAASYLAQIQAGQTNPGVHWDSAAFPIVYQFNLQGQGSNITGDRAAKDVLNLSFQTWKNAPNINISNQEGLQTPISAAGFDGTNLICFTCTGDFSKDAQTLGVTITTTADPQNVGQIDKNGRRINFAGQILDADILFNPSVTFTTNVAGVPADGKTNNPIDLQTVATHEIGHFFGLDHSGVVRAVMFPFAPETERTLGYDDIAGMATLYPKSSPDVLTGTISGKVTATDGTPIFGAHVFANPMVTNGDSFAAFNGASITIRRTPISAMTLADGTYTITGVPFDQYLVAAEPFDQPVTNAEISQYAPTLKGSGATVQTNFTTRWH